MSRQQGPRATPRSVRRLVGALVLAWALGGCAFTFGESPEAEDGSTQERRQDARRLYLEELERLERQRQTLTPIPSER